MWSGRKERSEIEERLRMAEWIVRDKRDGGVVIQNIYREIQIPFCSPLSSLLSRLSLNKAHRPKKEWRTRESVYALSRDCCVFSVDRRLLDFFFLSPSPMPPPLLGWASYIYMTPLPSWPNPAQPNNTTLSFFYFGSSSHCWRTPKLDSFQPYAFLFSPMLNRIPITLFWCLNPEDEYFDF